MYVRAGSGWSKIWNSAVGTSAWRISSLAKTLLPSIRAASLDGPKTLSPLAAQEIGQSGRQRVFRANHDQADLFLGRTGPGDRFPKGRWGRSSPRRRRCRHFPAHKDPGRASGLLQLPDQGVFAPALANDQHVHHELIRIAVQKSRTIPIPGRKLLLAVARIISVFPTSPMRLILWDWWTKSLAGSS